MVSRLISVVDNSFKFNYPGLIIVDGHITPCIAPGQTLTIQAEGNGSDIGILDRQGGPKVLECMLQTILGICQQ